MHLICNIRANQLSEYKIKSLQCQVMTGRANASLSFYKLLTSAYLLRIYLSEQYLSLFLYHIYANDGNMSPSCSAGGEKETLHLRLTVASVETGEAVQAPC